MTKKTSTEQTVKDFLISKGEATVDDIAAAVGISRTSARKYLAGLKQAEKLRQVSERPRTYEIAARK